MITAFLLTACLQESGTPRKLLDLIEQLGSDRAEERDRATEALRTLANEALPELRKAARERGGEVAARAGDLVRKIEMRRLLTPALRRLFPKLEAELLEGNPGVWMSAFSSLTFHRERYDDLPPGDRGLIYDKALQEAENDEDRKEILEELCIVPGVMDSLQVIPLLSAKDPDLRSLAAMALGNLGAKGAVVPLRAGLKDTEWQVRFRAAQSLGQLEAHAAVEDLKSLLADPVVSVAAAAARAIGHIGEREAEPSLRALLKKPGDLRTAAAHALADLGTDDSPALLLTILQEEEYHNKQEASERLAALGPKGIPGLRNCLTHKDASTRVLAVEALAHDSGPAVIPDMLALLGDPDFSVRRGAVDALAALHARNPAGEAAAGRPSAKNTVSELLKLLKDPAPYVRISAAQALCALGDGRGAPLLVKESKFRHKVVQQVISLTALNALREPAVWDRLASRPMSVPLEGHTQPILKRLSAAAGLKLEISDSDSDEDSDDDPWRERLISVRERRRHGTLLDAFRSVAGDGAFDFIFDSDRLRVVPHSEALKFWSDWWAGHGKK